MGVFGISFQQLSHPAANSIVASVGSVTATSGARTAPRLMHDMYSAGGCRCMSQGKQGVVTCACSFWKGTSCSEISPLHSRERVAQGCWYNCMSSTIPGVCALVSTSPAKFGDALMFFGLSLLALV